MKDKRITFDNKHYFRKHASVNESVYGRETETETERMKVGVS